MNLKNIKANQTELTLNDGTIVFFSYETPVAYILNGKGYRSLQVFSRTTTKHTNAFLIRNGCELSKVILQDDIEALVK